VLNIFPIRNQPPDPKSHKGFYSFFPFPRIKVESSKIEGSKPIIGLIPENHEHRNGDFDGDKNLLSGLSLFYLHTCDLLLLIRCTYVLIWLPFNVSGEISPTPRLEGNIR